MGGPGEQEQVAPVLIVEDNAGQRLTLRDILQGEGFSTLDCGSGEEAVELVQQHKVAVAIVDYKLPGLTGVETLGRLREIDEAIQVIIHTAYGSFDSAKDSVNLGAFAYLEKPSEPQELVRQVGRATRKWMEQALRRSLEMLRLLESALEQANLPVAVTTAVTEESERRYVFVNPAFMRMTGYAEDELVGQPPRLLYGAKTKRALLDRQRDLMFQGRSFVGEMIHYRKDGSQFFMESRVDPVRDDQGRITHWVSIYR